MAAFGENFDLARFRQAYETRTDMEAYSQAQVVEPALGRVQNYVADLSIAAPSSWAIARGASSTPTEPG